MADNRTVRDGNNINFQGAAQQINDNSYAPKITILAGDRSATPISPATSDRQDTANTELTAIAAVAGTAAGAAVITDAPGTLQQYLRGLVKLISTAGTIVLGAGSAIVGKFGIDQTTNGTTNKVYVDKSTTLDDAADVTLTNGAQTQILASVAARRAAIIIADPANTVNIRIGKIGQVGAARGGLLEPGASITLETTDQIYGFASAASQKVSIVLLKD